MSKSLFLAIIGFFCAFNGAAADIDSLLRADLVAIVGDRDIGVAVITDRGDTIGVNADRPYAMMSVVKFHQAVAIAHKLGYVGLGTRRCRIDSTDLRRDTWSPMAEKFPGLMSADATMLLRYSLNYSDNNAADILFRTIASPSETDSILRAVTPARNFAISRTEAQQNAVPACADDNHSTAADAATLAHWFFSADTCDAAVIVRGIMAGGSATGAARLPAGLPPGMGMFHKTGSGWATDSAVTAVNDVGFVVYPRPDGSTGYYSIAVFVRDFHGNVAEAEAVIADIGRVTWVRLGSDVPVTLADLGRRAQPVAVRQNQRRPAGSDGGINVGAALAGALLLGGIDSILTGAPYAESVANSFGALLSE